MQTSVSDTQESYFCLIMTYKQDSLLFFLTGNQFKLITSSRPANIFVTKPGHLFCKRWMSCLRGL